VNERKPPRIGGNQGSARLDCTRVSVDGENGAAGGSENGLRVTSASERAVDIDAVIFRAEGVEHFLKQDRLMRRAPDFHWGPGG
jgi:hypothetical protein